MADQGERRHERPTYDQLLSIASEIEAERDEARAALHSLVEGLEQVLWFCDEDMWVWRYPDQLHPPGGYKTEPVYRLSAGASAVLEAEKQ